MTKKLEFLPDCILEYYEIIKPQEFSRLSFIYNNILDGT